MIGSQGQSLGWLHHLGVFLACVFTLGAALLVVAPALEAFAEEKPAGLTDVNSNLLQETDTDFDAHQALVEDAPWASGAAVVEAPSLAPPICPVFKHICL